MSAPLYDRDRSFDFKKRKGNHFDSMRVYWTRRGTHYHVWLNQEHSSGSKYQTKRRFELLVSLSGAQIDKLTYDYLSPNDKT